MDVKNIFLTGLQDCQDSFSCGSCILWLITVVCFLLCPMAQAELTWEKKVIRLDVHPLQVEGRAAFRFNNAGTNTVDLLTVRTTCGCMSASASTNQVAPNESGTIDVLFNYRDKIGPQRKAVAIRTSDSKPIFLYVEANIKPAYRLSVKRLDWSLASVASCDESDQRVVCEPQICRLVNRTKTPFKLISASSSSDRFAVELLAIREGFEYEVRVMPDPSINVPTRAVITIQTDCPSELEESRIYRFNASLR